MVEIAENGEKGRIEGEEYCVEGVSLKSYLIA